MFETLKHIESGYKCQEGVLLFAKTISEFTMIIRKIVTLILIFILYTKYLIFETNL